MHMLFLLLTNSLQTLRCNILFTCEMCKVQTCPSIFIGRESDHWLPLSITDSLLLSKLDLCVCVKMPTQNLLGLLLLLMLIMWIVLATVCCRFGSWGLVIKLDFCSDLEHKVWSKFWSWSSGKICMVRRFSTLEKGWLSCRHWLPLSLTHSVTYFPTIRLLRDAVVWLKFWS